MPAPAGLIVDLSTIEKQIGMLKMYLGRNSVSAYKTVSALILSEMTTINSAIQASTINTGLSEDPTLSLRFDYDPDPGIASNDGTQGPNNVVITGS